MEKIVSKYQDEIDDMHDEAIIRRARERNTSMQKIKDIVLNTVNKCEYAFDTDYDMAKQKTVEQAYSEIMGEIEKVIDETSGHYFGTDNARYIDTNELKQRLGIK